jgi:trehalose synthase-fused probable maltokinase
VVEQLQHRLNESRSWLRGQRWFGDKSRGLIDITVERSATLDAAGAPVEMVVLRCAFDDGGSSRYFLPVIGLGQDDMRDGFTEGEFRCWFYEGFLRNRTIETDDGTWRWAANDPDSSHIGAVNFERSTLLRREQSNSSIIYDDRLIAKVFRKLEHGINPDIEIGQMFAVTDAKVASPKMVGAVTFEEPSETTVIAILQQFVHNVGDGWGWLLEQLRSGSRHAIEAIRLLGERTGEMHLALANSSSEPAFSRESFANADLEDMQRRLVHEVDLTFTRLRSVEADDSRQLEQIRAALRGLATNLDPYLGTDRIRIHGDYHLGQVLRTVENDFSIIDYEGEPSRPISERRRKWPALKDVAGMVRSFDYAAETIARERGESDTFATWRDEATAAFINGYKSVVGPDQRLYPENPEGFDIALSAMVIEKALYEARYEMDNRPDWLPIPYRALVRLSGVGQG